MMKIKAKFPGKCRVCGVSFKEGAEIAWTKRDGASCCKCAYGATEKSEAQIAEVSDEFLKGIAAAVEIASETGQRSVLHTAVASATDALGVVPELTEGMSYADALGTIRATLATVREGAPAPTEMVAVSQTTNAVGVPEAEEFLPEASIGVEERDENFLVIAPEAEFVDHPYDQKGLDELSEQKKGGGSAVESTPIDPADEDDEWLGEW